MQAPPSYQSGNQPRKNNNVLWIVLGILGVCGCGGIAVMAAILFPVFQQAKAAATKAHALSNVKQSALALLLYAGDNNEVLPEGTLWMDRTEPYTKNSEVFKSPALTKDQPEAYGFAFRKELSNKNTSKYILQDRWAMVFDSSILTRNASSGLETLPSPPRYGSTNMVGFLDGHAKAIREDHLHSKGVDGQPLIR